eukprot:2320244-Pleurochrysis_carterae.AAC.2
MRGWLRVRVIALVVWVARLPAACARALALRATPFSPGSGPKSEEQHLPRWFDAFGNVANHVFHAICRIVRATQALMLLEMKPPFEPDLEAEVCTPT